MTATNWKLASLVPSHICFNTNKAGKHAELAALRQIYISAGCISASQSLQRISVQSWFSLECMKENYTHPSNVAADPLFVHFKLAEIARPC